MEAAKVVPLCIWDELSASELYQPTEEKKNPYRHTQAVLRHNASSFMLYYLQEAALNGRENWKGAGEPQAVFPVVPLGWVGVVALNTISYKS